LVKFLSLEFYKQLQTLANNDSEFKMQSRDFVASFAFKVLDRAELPFIYMKFNNSQISELRVLNKDEKTDYSLEGNYAIWVDVSQGKMDGATAVMTRDLIVTGSMGNLIRYGKAFKKLLDLMSKVPSEY
jgi:hypothetical protein